MISFECARKMVISRAVCTQTEDTGLSQACGRHLAQEVKACCDMPPFDKSAVDGFACRREDVLKMTPSKSLRLIEVIPAGKVPEMEVREGCCSKIMTGAPLPKGADMVLMVEQCSTIGAGSTFPGQFVSIKPEFFPVEKIASKSNICYRGEDVKNGDVLLRSGILIRPHEVAVIATCGLSEVKVFKKVKVGVISTGSELLEPGSIRIGPGASLLPKGKIFNSNSWQLTALLETLGARAQYYGIAPDNAASTERLMMRALDENQVVILSGGVSEGDFDFVPKIMKKLGMTILFDRVAVQPGKPTTFAVGEDISGESHLEKYIIGLPGNPVSAYVQTILLVNPLLETMQGGTYQEKRYMIQLIEDYHRSNSERLAHIPVKILNNGGCSLIKYNGSAHISALSEADALMRVPIGVNSISAGEKVTVVLLP